MSDRTRGIISERSVIEAAEGQVSSELGEEVAILHLQSGVYYGLDPVGARVWNLLQEEPRKVNEIRDTLLEEYDVEPERCTRDLLALLQKMAEEGLIEVRHQAPA